MYPRTNLNIGISGFCRDSYKIENVQTKGENHASGWKDPMPTRCRFSENLSTMQFWNF